MKQRASSARVRSWKKRRFVRMAALIAGSVTTFASSAPVKVAETKTAQQKKPRQGTSQMGSVLSGETALGSDTPPCFLPPPLPLVLTKPGEPRFPWKQGIVTTTFWVGELPAKNNPVPNTASSWDENWGKNFGGYDTPDRSQRANFLPVKFVPKQNPFYVALPYNDMTREGHKPGASKWIPWFQKDYKGPSATVLKGRWVAIRFGKRVAYAQWEDCGPFRTDHPEYVFGNDRPKPNLNKGAGLDVSPAVRDFLGMADTDVTDWRFVDFDEIPPGPWSTHGDNNTFVINQRENEKRLVLAGPIQPGPQ